MYSRETPSSPAPIKKRKRETPSSPAPIVNNTTSSSTSASASAADLVGEYDVFLSFRGTDTRNHFTDYLYNVLISAGVRTFRDDNELRVGEEIGPELLRAIKQSKISIPVFSKNYASSKWCLRELAYMVECRANGGQLIFPIFYDVELNEVQHYERGSYKDAFDNHKRDKELDEKTVQQWKEALEIVGDLKGLELKKETNGRQGEFVKIVVEVVLSKLKKKYKRIPENLVGMDSHIKEMKKLLDIDYNCVRIIGIHGMGGLGKTTLAKVIYNKFCELFECHCFLDDVRENSNSNDNIVKLQKKLVFEILKRETKFDNVDQGINEIKDAIHRKKVLIVFDDVDKNIQIDMLAGNHRWYEAGSRIIITTRDEAVLLPLERTCQNEALHELYRCYKPKLMDDNHALQLVSKYAFMRDSPPEGYNALAMEVVSSAGGLPLVLVTLSSLLFIEKDKVSWQEKLKKLKALPPPEVLGRLRISYDALDKAQKQIFLDIACLFSGWDKTYPCYMWEACKFYPWEGINALVRRSLITVGDDNILWMHNRLRELGEQIICEENEDEPGEWSRLWRAKVAANILMTNQGTKDVKALCLHRSKIHTRRLEGQYFSKLPNLRYLRMYGIDLDGDFKNFLQNLIWLRWRCWSKICAPTNFNPENLVVLDLSRSKFTDDWGGWSQIKMLNKLKVLNLTRCKSIRGVPHLSGFPTLERLELDGCYCLGRLDGLEELESLKYLNIHFCYGLEMLPDLSKLTKLQTLNARCCSKLTAIQGLDKLESLEVLDTSLCFALERLPNLSNLEKLTRFMSSQCRKLVEIHGLDRLASLEYLDISGCKSLKSLLDLSNLKKLHFCYAELESLKYLNISDCDELERLLDLSKLTKLQTLNVRCCWKLTAIQGLDKLESLEVLDTSFCYALERLPNLSNLEKLTRFESSHCKKLVEIHGLDRLASLEHLNISGCESLKSLPDLSNLKKLRNLMVAGLKLTKVQGLGDLESLEHLNMNHCQHIEGLSDLSKLRWLRKLEISSCHKLVEIQGLDRLESLEHLDMYNCKSIENLPDFSNLTNLKWLDVSYCVKLTEIRGLEELKFLRRLRIAGCKSLENNTNRKGF